MSDDGTNARRRVKRHGNFGCSYFLARNSDVVSIVKILVIFVTSCIYQLLYFGASVYFINIYIKLCNLIDDFRYCHYIKYL